MPNDAKLGLVVGVALVITVAVVFFRGDVMAKRSPQGQPPAATVNQTPAPPLPAAPRGQHRPTKARPALRDGEPRQHTVVEGDTLAGLAERYLGDKGRADEIRKANADALSNPDELTPGTVLVIPPAEEKSADPPDGDDN